MNTYKANFTGRIAGVRRTKGETFELTAGQAKYENVTLEPTEQVIDAPSDAPKPKKGAGDK
ncbi:hypothetical protein [Sulfitobacter sp.]|uniref:hypothetical protein n=1 Tax=Sulfitobacter sp. TaxID=1903071 RepID=UPI0030018485